MTKANLLEVITAIGRLSGDGYFVYDLKSSSVDYVNASLLSLFDISHESFRHQPAFFLNHIVPDDLEGLTTHRQEFEKKHKIENIEFRLKGHDNSIKHVSCSAYIVMDQLAIGILRDLTASREHENYIINYGAKKNTLLDMVSHNLSVPLTVSKNLLESMSRSKGTADIDTHLKLIKENTEQCIQMVTELLEEEHLVSENIYVKKNRFDLFTKIMTIVERFRKSYPDYQFRIECKNKESTISTDDVKLLQVLNNLLSNAIKWSKPGSNVDIVIVDEKGSFSISVKDYGIGIPEKYHERLFQRNTPASRPGLQGEKSVGMGLYIVRKLVQLMDGDVTFESKENHGTTFTIKLPKQ